MREKNQNLLNKNTPCTYISVNIIIENYRTILSLEPQLGQSKSISCLPSPRFQNHTRKEGEVDTHRFFDTAIFTSKVKHF
jgi:hypothetical protein